MRRYTAIIAIMVFVLALAVSVTAQADFNVASAGVARTFRLVAVDASQANVLGATLTPLDVVSGSLEYSTEYTGNRKGTATMRGSVNGDVLEGLLKTDVRIIDSYGTEYYRIHEVAFTSTPIPEAGGTMDIIFGDGTVRTNVTESGEEVVRQFRLDHRVTYKVVRPGTEPPTEDGVEDSGIRFSGIAGSIQVLVPYGYDENGEPLYEDEGWNWAQYDMVLPWDTKIKIGERSEIVLSWPDMTTFHKTMKDDEAIIILPSRPIDEGAKGVLKLMAGNLWTNIKKIIEDGTMDVECGQAVAGIKGTTFVLTEDGTTTTLKVIEGVVRFTSKADGSSTMVESGQMVVATASGLSEKQPFDIDAEIAAFDTGPAARTSPAPWVLAVAIAAAVIAVVAVVLIVRRRSTPSQPTGACLNLQAQQ